jgi:hypothetical protein
MFDYEKLGAFYLGKEFDLERGKTTRDVVLYDAKDLTTHGVIVGMTGSGKTGLGIALLEEAAIDGIPAIVIDPKGDMGNLLLQFPALEPDDFRPWVEKDEAARKALTPDELAGKTATTWREGLAAWDQPAERIAKLRAAADFAIYTPGSDAGLPLSVLKSLDAPPQAVLDSGDAFRERVSAAVSGLLALLGIDADPLRGREHILLSNILDQAWRAGRHLDMAALIREVQSPPFKQIGIMDLETIFPAAERMGLAMTINNVLASPGFSGWMRGEALNVQKLLYTAEGKPRVSILSIAHLSDNERMFFVTLLLNEVLTWMRAQPGTSSLRALVYMDEVFGYLPPTANPPSKLPLLTLLKQARAFGVGLVLATQNPVDLDYKALSNAGTWWVGRLQTERDKARLLDGLEGAAASAGARFDRSRTEKIISSLGQRVFLMNNVHEDVPVVFQTRWALSYLRGPLTREQIATLMAERKGTGVSAASGAAPAPATAAPAGGAPERATPSPATAADVHPPMLPPEVKQSYASVSRSTPRDAAITYCAALLGSGRLHFVDAKSRSNVDTWVNVARLCRIGDSLPADVWGESDEVDVNTLNLQSRPDAEARFAAAPVELTRAKSYRDWAGALKDYLYREGKLTLFYCAALKEYARPGEDEGAFRGRLQHGTREQRDLEVERLRKKYAPKIESLQDKLRRARQRVDVEKSQATQATVSSAMSFGATVLGALFGRKLRSATNVSKAATSMRSAGRAVQERGDIARAEENAQALEQALEDLEAEFKAETDRMTCELASAEIKLQPYEIGPRKSDIAVGDVTLVWLPYKSTGSGAAGPAWA